MTILQKKIVFACEFFVLANAAAAAVAVILLCLNGNKVQCSTVFRKIIITKKKQTFIHETNA